MLAWHKRYVYVKLTFSSKLYHQYWGGRHGRVSMVVVYTTNIQLPVQSVPVTTKVVSWNPIHGEVYSMQHYVIEFVSDVRQVRVFSWYSVFLHR